MRISSFLLSILLHLALLAFVLYVPLRPPLDITRPVYQVSLVMGAPGGENLPSPVLGARPPVTGRQELSTEPAPSPRAEEAPAVPTPELLPKPELPQPEKPRAPEPVKAPDAVDIPQQPQPKPEKKPDPQPEKKPEPKPEKKPEPKPEKKPEPAREPKPEPKKEQKPAKSSQSDPLAAALADARKQVRSNAGTGRGSSASRALADLEKQVGQTGVGGGGGEGDGPGGGGIYDVYVAQVVLAVQPNWSMPTYSRTNMVVQVRIKLDKQGHVLDCRIEQSSGRPEFDASAINAVVRTGTLPPPPTAAQQDLVISFNSLQMAGR